ncbi:MAG: helix-turn-helix domain-containing protein [Thermaerobacter sp.]
MALAADAAPAGRILEAAARLFLTRGAARVGMRDIAREAGVAVGTLYNYYRDKADLSRAVQERAAEELVRRLRLERLNPGRPLGEKVRALVDAALAAAPLFSEPEPLVQLMTPAFVWLLEEGQIRGDLPRAEAVIDSLARLLAEVVAGAGFVLQGDGAGRAQAGRRLAALLAEGLPGAVGAEAAPAAEPGAALDRAVHAGEPSRG